MHLCLSLHLLWWVSLLIILWSLAASSSSSSSSSLPLLISSMMDHQTVCCMCGDVGFPDKLFRCRKCLNRFQHSYCSNYNSEFSEPIEVCDWCQSEERNGRHGNSSKKSGGAHDRGVITNRSEYSGDKIKQHDHREEISTSAEKGRNPGGLPSPRPTTRRYKLLKDVMC